MSERFSNLLAAWRDGDAEAGDALIAETYGELRRIAHAQLRRERRRNHLQTTALLHDAYLRLLRTGPGTVEDREAFFRLMACEMRRRLIDHARHRLADKRGGRVIHEQLQGSALDVPAGAPDSLEAQLERLDVVLGQLARLFPRTARVVELRFLAGLTTDETAAALGLSSGTVKREWAFARAWLAAALDSPTPT